jgi:hypothetical protein
MYNTATAEITYGDFSSLLYTTSNATWWATSSPTTVKAALDRLASAVYALRGNSGIPL